MGYALKGKIILITGASAGIGRACAMEFARAGATVVAAARSLEKLQALATEIGEDRVMPIEMDVTTAEDRTRALAAVKERFGRLDVLVNNAGWASFSTFWSMPDEHVQRMLALNLLAPIVLTRMVLPEMIERGSGQIVNIASVVGFQAIPRMTTYSATKAALVSISTGLRMELARTGVDVILVAPGSTRTDFFETAGQVDAKAERLASTLYPAERVARTVVRACRRQKSETILTAGGIAISYVRRFSRRLADCIMRQVAKSAMPLKKD